MNEKKKTGVIAIAALMAVLFFAIGSVQAAEVQRYFDNVEGGIAGWTEETLAGVSTDSLWHITETRANSATHSWWYGQEATSNYDTGIANSGCLVSPIISLNGDATAAKLKYWTWWKTETSSSYDLKRVYVRPVGDAAILLDTLPGGQCQDAAGVTKEYTLSDYIINDEVQILFCFKTRDAKYNAYEGWFVDDIEVLVEEEGPTPSESDLEVTKTVLNEKTGEWVDEILCAEQNANLSFKCVINNTGDTSLTNVRFWDIMTCSLDYQDRSAEMLLPGGMWTEIIPEGEPHVFKQKLLHSIDYESGDPVASIWAQIHPGEDVTYEINAWDDTNNDRNLTVCDQIHVVNMTDMVTDRYHVDRVNYTLNTINTTGDMWYFDSMAEYDYANPNITNPIIDPDYKSWVKVCPDGCPDLEWSSCVVNHSTDVNGNGILDSGDSLFLVCSDETATCYTLTEDVKPDIWVSKEWDVDELNESSVILHPGENVTVIFNASVVAYGDDYNTQCAKAINESFVWIYSNCDEVHIRAPKQRVYLSPVNSSSTYCNCAEVELRIDACDFKSGGIGMSYDVSCVNLSNFVNSTDFPMTEWNWSWDWITFATDQETLTGDYLIGTLSLHCENVSGCISDLELGGAVFDPYGTWKDVSFEDGTFECNVSHLCGDVNVDGLITIGDVGDLHNGVAYDWPVADPWAGNVNCWDGLEMGDVGLLHNYVQYGDPPYTLNCC